MQDDIITGLGQLLRNADPSNPQQLAEAEAVAGAALTVAMVFVQERFGRDTAALVVNSMFEQATAAMSAQGHPASTGASLPTLHPAPAEGDLAVIQDRAEVMFGYLTGRSGADADIEAKASIWAAAGYLQRRIGEGATLDFMAFIRSKVGLLGWFEQLPPASDARN